MQLARRAAASPGARIMSHFQCYCLDKGADAVWSATQGCVGNRTGTPLGGFVCLSVLMIMLLMSTGTSQIELRWHACFSHRWRDQWVMESNQQDEPLMRGPAAELPR